MYFKTPYDLSPPAGPCASSLFHIDRTQQGHILNTEVNFHFVFLESAKNGNRCLSWVSPIAVKNYNFQEKKGMKTQEENKLFALLFN